MCLLVDSFVGFMARCEGASHLLLTPWDFLPATDSVINFTQTHSNVSLVAVTKPSEMPVQTN